MTLVVAIIGAIVFFGLGSFCMLMAKNLGIAILKALNIQVELPDGLKNVFGKKD